MTVASIVRHAVAGGLRTSPLPTAETDGSGKVYVAWQDCRFRTGCASNDIVIATSTDGVTWSAVSRIPIDATSSLVDHFVPGLGVDKRSSSAAARLGLAYYYYPQSACTASTCQLDVGFVSSTDGGLNWSAPTQLAGPMTLSWLPSTTQGRMVGDYISTSWSNTKAWPVFAVALAPSGGLFHEAMYTVSGGLAPAAATARATSAGARATRTPARSPAATAR